MLVCYCIYKSLHTKRLLQSAHASEQSVSLRRVTQTIVSDIGL